MIKRRSDNDNKNAVVSQMIDLIYYRTLYKVQIYAVSYVHSIYRFHVSFSLIYHVKIGGNVIAEQIVKISTNSSHS